MLNCVVGCSEKKIQFCGILHLLVKVAELHLLVLLSDFYPVSRLLFICLFIVFYFVGTISLTLID